MTLDSFIFTSPGGRDHNEDAAAERRLDSGGLFVLCDGLGGHRCGELAAERAIDAVLADPPPEPEERPEDFLTARLEEANRRILVLQRERATTMKTTAAALLLRDGEAVWANVGDSRVYRIHRRELREVTRDHSVAYQKYLAGEITRGQIPTDPDQSSLLRSLGNPERHAPDLHRAGEPPEPGDAFLLCSDGVWEYLPDGEILIDYLKAGSAREWGESLLLRVIGRVPEGNDNLSLITVLVNRDDGPRRAGPRDTLVYGAARHSAERPPEPAPPPAGAADTGEPVSPEISGQAASPPDAGQKADAPPDAGPETNPTAPEASASGGPEEGGAPCA